MTKQECIDWLAQATPEQVIAQLERAVLWSQIGDFETKIKSEEELGWIKAELLKRMK